ncbi:MAG TPA: hypothetical protein G4O03_01845 [Dehalococcoidia bacterium]|nr:hypothetical protein [Dehalococcoidia bacterium]
MPSAKEKSHSTWGMFCSIHFTQSDRKWLSLFLGSESWTQRRLSSRYSAVLAPMTSFLAVCRGRTP